MSNLYELSDLGNELAILVNSLPPQEHQRIKQGVSHFVHDLRQSVGIILSAEKLLRRKMQSPSEDIELVDAIHTASQHIASLLADFAHPFESENPSNATTPPEEAG